MDLPPTHGFRSIREDWKLPGYRSLHLMDYVLVKQRFKNGTLTTTCWWWS